MSRALQLHQPEELVSPAHRTAPTINDRVKARTSWNRIGYLKHDQDSNCILSEYKSIA